MNAEQFERALKLAQDLKIDLSFAQSQTNALFSFGLPSFPATETTIAAVALVIRWQALSFNGSWDQDAIQEVREISRYKFVISEEITKEDAQILLALVPDVGTFATLRRKLTLLAK